MNSNTSIADTNTVELLLNWLISLPADIDPAVAAQELLQVLPTPLDEQATAQIYSWLEQISCYPRQQLSMQLKAEQLSKARN